ncbi:MAG: hypothetical protein ACRDGP_00225 [Actinomycetota bacterium]
MVVSAFVLMTVPAVACPVTDLSCLPQTVADPVTAVQGAVDQTTTTVEETATTVTDTVNEAVEPITDAVKEVLGQAPDPLDPGVIDDPTGILPDVLGSTVTQPSGPGATRPGGNGSATGPGVVKSRTVGGGGGAGLSRFGRGPVIGPVAAPISSTSAASLTNPRQGLVERIRSLAIQAAEALAFPLALALIVLLFVAVQNRIDRKDPKLALAPVAPDLLRFE